jgi:hypothetical protein
VIRSQPTSEKHRPRTVIVLAGFLFLATPVALVTGTSLLFPGPWWNRMWELNPPAYAAFSRLSTASGIMLLALSVVTALTGTGLLLGKRWAWWIAVSIFTLDGLGDAFTLFVKRDAARGGSGLLIALVFLFCLFRPAVQRYFDALLDNS